MDKLKLIALDAEDLAVVSAHLQDAVVRVGDMAYLPKSRRFAMVANRFDWAAPGTKGRKAPFQRRRAGLRFERVMAARVAGLDLAAKGHFLSLLAVRFEPAELPAGTIRLDFSGGAGVALDVEYIEAELKDLGAAWATPSKPHHPDEEPGSTS
jgi:hypothetical protein